VPDQAPLARFVAAAGDQSISIDQMREVLRHKKCDENVELIAGDICETVPRYAQDHPEFRISMINLDTDVYEPAVAILEHLYPRLLPGGILIVDDYGVFPGETRAVDEYFRDKPVRIQKFPFCTTPCYILKEA
jgi:predicted O-methyltransferase YrrM